MQSRQNEVVAEDTAYGFRYGAAMVERMFNTKGYVAIRVRTKTGKYVDIFVSPTGRSLQTVKGAAKTLRF